MTFSRLVCPSTGFEHHTWRFGSTCFAYVELSVGILHHVCTRSYQYPRYFNMVEPFLTEQDSVDVYTHLKPDR